MTLSEIKCLETITTLPTSLEKYKMKTVAKITRILQQQYQLRRFETRTTFAFFLDSATRIGRALNAIDILMLYIHSVP